MSFAQIAKDLRNEKGLSQMQLSKKIGISAAGIGYLELGKREPTSPTLIAYAKFFDVSADFLLGLEDDFGVRTPAPSSEAAYSSKEREIIKKYRELNTHGKNAVETVIDTYLATMAESKQNKKA